LKIGIPARIRNYGLFHAKIWLNHAGLHLLGTLAGDLGRTPTGKIIGVFGIVFLLDDAQSILSPVADSDALHLSQRQMDCLMHLVKGKTIKQIAQALHLSAKTVEHYLNAIKLKLNAQDRSEVIEKALQLTAIRERL